MTLSLPPLSTLRTIHARRRKADAFEDVASAIDTGLGVDALRAVLERYSDRQRVAAASFERGIAPVLGHVLECDEVDRAVLAAAEEAGELPDALRERAEDARALARFASGLLFRLAYPAFLLACAFGVAVFLQAIGRASVWTPIAISLGLVVALAFGAALVVRRVRNDPDFRIPAWFAPLAAPALARDFGEVAYLGALRRLYAAGVRIDRAHATAAATAPVARVRARLFAAGSAVESGHPLVPELRRLDAVGRETLDVLEPAHDRGDLEAALARAAERATFRLRAGLDRLVASVGGIAYLIAAGTVAAVVFSFYASYLAMLR
jgi:type II secretory pathway component PulF